MAGREARALLVGPVDHLDRIFRPDAEIVEGADHLERAEHAEHAVIAAAGRLGVEMAADHHRRQRRVGALAAGEHGAHAVDVDRHAGGLAPALEQPAALAVLVGQRLAVAAAAHARADLGDLVDRVPEPVAVDPEIVGGLAHCSDFPFLAIRRAPRAPGPTSLCNLRARPDNPSRRSRTSWKNRSAASPSATPRGPPAASR